MALERKGWTEPIVGAAIEVKRDSPGTEAPDRHSNEFVPAFLPSSFTLGCNWRRTVRL
jgi:hypothetical protein